MLRSIGGYHSFSAGLVIGGKNLKDERSRLSRMNILVATPGRLLQHMDQTVGFDADNLQVLGKYTDHPFSPHEPSSDQYFPYQYLTKLIEYLIWDFSALFLPSYAIFPRRAKPFSSPRHKHNPSVTWLALVLIIPLPLAFLYLVIQRTIFISLPHLNSTM